MLPTGEHTHVGQNGSCTTCTNNSQSVSQSVSQSSSVVQSKQSKTKHETKVQNSSISIRLSIEDREALRPYLSGRQLSKELRQLIHFWLAGKRGTVSIDKAIQEKEECMRMDQLEISTLQDQKTAILHAEAKAKADEHKWITLRKTIEGRVLFFRDSSYPTTECAATCAVWARKFDLPVKDVQRLFMEVTGRTW